MALHEKDSNSSIIFLNASCGKFKKYNGPGAEPEYFEAVDGNLQRITILHDEGNREKKIKPYDRLTIELSDGPDKYVISGRHPSTFSWMFASHLIGLKGGDRIKIRVWAGSDIDKVTVCMVDKLNELSGAWEKCQRDSYPKDDEEAKFGQASTDIEAHETFVQPDQWRPAKREEPEPARREPVAVGGGSDDEWDPFQDE